MKRKILWAEGIVVSIATAYLIGQIIYTGIPYNGALSWKIDQRLNQKEVTLEHDNYFEDGVEGVLADLDEALDMPEELYIVNQYQMTFDETGKIKTIYTFLYGQDENGKTNTYLIDYDESSGPNITVRINGNATTDYEEDKRLEPMLTILQKAPCEEAVKTWAQADIGEEFEVVFIDSKRYYIVDKDGNVGEAQEIIKDKNPGDITIGKDGETLDGSEEHPYEIWCIEDLVTFSNMVNGSGIKLENGEVVKIETANSFKGKYIVLKTNLNFKSKLSYQNSERTDFGDINGDTDDGNTLINEMTTGTGFRPIGNEKCCFERNF